MVVLVFLAYLSPAVSFDLKTYFGYNICEDTEHEQFDAFRRGCLQVYRLPAYLLFLSLTAIISAVCRVLAVFGSVVSLFLDMKKAPTFQ